MCENCVFSGILFTVLLYSHLRGCTTLERIWIPIFCGYLKIYIVVWLVYICDSYFVSDAAKSKAKKSKKSRKR